MASKERGRDEEGAERQSGRGLQGEREGAESQSGSGLRGEMGTEMDSSLQARLEASKEG